MKKLFIIAIATCFVLLGSCTKEPVLPQDSKSNTAVPLTKADGGGVCSACMGIWSMTTPNCPWCGEPHHGTSPTSYMGGIKAPCYICQNTTQQQFICGGCGKVYCRVHVLKEFEEERCPSCGKYF